MASSASNRLRDASVQFRTAVGQMAGTYAFLLQQEADAALDLETAARGSDKTADCSHEWDDVVELSRLRSKFGKALVGVGPLPTTSEPEEEKPF